MMRRWIWLGLAVLLLAGLGILGYTRVSARASREVTLETVPVQRATIVASASVSGTVVNTRTARLPFGTAGIISELPVQVGEQVAAGHLLARLDSTGLKRSLEQARLNLESAEINLQKTLNAYTAQDIADAQEAARSAQDALESARRNVTITQVSATVATTPRQRQDEYGYYVNNLAKLEESKAAASAIDAARNNAQDAYTRLIEANERASDAMVKAQSAVVKAEYDLARAQGKVAVILAGPDPRDVRLKQNQVEQARFSLESAEEAMAQATLVAPFGGTVTLVSGQVGDRVSGTAVVVELVDPAQMVVEARVDESQITSVQIGQQVALSFDSIQATASRPLSGQVTKVAFSGTTQQGIVSYLVTSELSERSGATGRQVEATRVALRPGMTATVEIVTARAENVLVVPNRALRRGAQGVQVLVLRGTEQEQRPVRTGLANDQVTEIIEGLAEGELVVVPSGTTATLTQPQGFRGFGGFGGAGGAGIGGGMGIVPAGPAGPGGGFGGR